MNREPTAVIEDLEDLNSFGTGAIEAARRTGFPSAEAMERWLRRTGRPDLWLALAHRDPAGTHTNRTTRKEQRMKLVVPADPQRTIDAVLARAQQSTYKRTRNRAEKIRSLVAELEQIIEDERKLRRREVETHIKELEAQLKKARAELDAEA